MMRHRYLPMIAAIALGAAACAGPDQDLEVEVSGRLANLDLSEAHAAALTLPMPPYVPGPEAAEGAPDGWVVNPDIAEAPKPNPTGSAACKFTDPRQAVERAVDAPTRPPAETSYRYFAEGLFEAVSTDGGENAVMPDETVRSVQNVTWGPGQTYYDFDMAVEAAQGVTTTRYRVVLDDPDIVRPDVPRPVNVREPPPPFLAPPEEPPIVGSVRVGTPAQPGMYMLSVQADGGEPQEFNDGAGMLLVRWPALEGDSFNAQATVGNQQITYTSTVADDGQVEACGTLLDSKAVNIGATVVPLDGDDPAVTVDATYNIAPQYGGLVVADSRTTTIGNDATSATKETVTARITQKPDPPGAPARAPTCPRVPAGAEPLPAGAAIDTPPVETTYRMTVPPTGEPVSVYQVAGLDTDAGKLPGTLIRSVQNVEWGPGREYFEYETADNLGGSITTTKYRVVPAPEDADPPPAEPELGSPGMYLVSTTHPDGELVEYNDGAGMLMVPFPFAPEPDAPNSGGAAKHTMVGSDGENDVVVAVYVEPNEVVTACGTLVEGWRVDVVIDPGQEPGPRPEATEYVDTRLLPPEEPPVPEDEPPLPEPSRPTAADSGPRSQLELMRPYTDYLHDEGHVRANYSFTIAPSLGGLPVTFRSSMTSLERADVFGQSLVYTMSSTPEVPR